MGTPILNLHNIHEVKIPFVAIVMYIIRHVVPLDILTIRNIDNKTPFECIAIGGGNDVVIEEFLTEVDYRRQELECLPMFK